MADPELSHLRQTIAVATSSWQEAEVARQVAQRESIAVKQALHQLETQPHVASGDATADEEQRLRKQLEAIQAERERKAQVDKLQEEAARSARSVAAAEIEAKMRHLHLEKVEAQQQAAAARAEAQEAMQGAQRHGGCRSGRNGALLGRVCRSPAVATRRPRSCARLFLRFRRACVV